MTKRAAIIVGMMSVYALSLDAREGVCHKCEEIRKYNDEHHQNFEYFEDYLSLQEGDAGAGAEQEPAEPHQTEVEVDALR